MVAKRESRAARKERLRKQALALELPTSCDLIVLGGGAAGLVAAICAAEEGASVVVLERELECGRTILATGNGRCNFANVKLDPKRYNRPDFVEAVCGAHWLEDVLDFFRSCGLRWDLEDDRLYPSSRSAASVRNVLLRRAREAGVILAPGREVVDVCVEGSAEKELRVRPHAAERQDIAAALPCARSLIVATGGRSLPQLEALGIRTHKREPVLCPLACQDSPLLALDGKRAQASARLTKAGALFPSWQARGEVLFRSYGLSGILSFDLSRRAQAQDLIELDLAPEVSESELRLLVDQFASGSFDAGCLDGVLDPDIASLIEKLALERWQIRWPERKAPASKSEALISLVKSLPFVVVGPAKPEQAQVMRGGLNIEEFDPQTLASKKQPWLFACGEALDIDADCGGFNLAWAWKSGMVAGRAAAQRSRA